MPKVLVLIGLIFLTTGLVLQLWPGALKWFGHLPGDIRIEEEHTRIYIPITSMLIVSIVLSALARIWK